MFVEMTKAKMVSTDELKQTTGANKGASPIVLKNKYSDDLADAFMALFLSNVGTEKKENRPQATDRENGHAAIKRHPL